MSKEIDWSKAPEGADKYNTHNSMFYKGERPDLQVFIREKWMPTAIIKSNELFVYRPTTPSWSGEGLPPVGVACKIIGGDSKWWSYSGFESGEIVTVRHSFKNSKGYDMVVVEGCDGGCLAVTADCVAVIRTPEQVAADEREAQIVAINDAIVTSVKVTLGQCDSWRKVAEMVYNAGFKRE